MTTNAHSRRILAPLLAATLALAACGTDDSGSPADADSPDRTVRSAEPSDDRPSSAGDSPAAVYRGMLRALSAGDSTAACAAMTGDLRRNFGGRPGTPCVERLKNATAADTLIRQPKVGAAEVDGDQARLHVKAGETRYDVLLVKLGDEWKVAGTGSPR